MNASHRAPFMFNPWVTQLAAPAIPTIAAWAAQYGGQQGPLLGLSQAVPGYPPHPLLMGWLAELAADPRTCEYGDIEGEPELRSAYAAWCNRLYQLPTGGGLSAAHVQITAGCNQAFAVALKAMVREGDSVALIEPYYFNHQSTLESMGVALQYVPARAERGFLPDLDDVRATLQRGVKALIVISPNNPTGAVYPPGLLNAIADLCQRHSCWLVLDETYREFLHDTEHNPPHHLLARPHWERHVVLLYSFSKSLCIPGHRLGVVVAGAALQAEIAKVVDNLQICAPRVAQLAVARALDEPVIHAWIKDNREEMARRAHALQAAFAALPAGSGWRVASVGAYFAFAEHPYTQASSQQVAKTLAQRHGLLTVPGEFFGAHQQRYLRIAFANVQVAELGHITARLQAMQAP